jgi:hypothetical protein
MATNAYGYARDAQIHHSRGGGGSSSCDMWGWNPNLDRHRAIHWDENQVLLTEAFACNSVLEALEAKFPASREGHTRVTECPGQRNVTFFFVTVHAADEWLTQMNMDLLLRLTKQYKAVNVGFNSDVFRWARHESYVELLEAGMYLVDAFDNKVGTWAKYNPKVAAKRLARHLGQSPVKRKSPKPAAFQIWELQNVINALNHEFTSPVARINVSDPYATLNRRQVFAALLGLFNLVTAIYGPTAPRYSQQVSNFFQEWKTRGDATRKMWCKWMPGSQAEINKFADWLDEESQCRKRKPRKPKVPQRIPAKLSLQKQSSS